jgi:hypothetical protein
LTSIWPSPAISPTAVPLTPAKIIDPRTFTCASPARKCPIKAMAKLNILSVMPTEFIDCRPGEKGTARRCVVDAFEHLQRDDIEPVGIPGIDQGQDH